MTGSLPGEGRASPPPCPTCSSDLTEQETVLVCHEGHRYTATGLALTTNLAAVSSIWKAIRHLEDDAAGLRYLATCDLPGLPPSDRQLQEATEAVEAAQALRPIVAHAQERLDALPVAATATEEQHSQRGRGG